jgi:hypothetical protein
MKTALLSLAVLLLVSVSGASASIVIHDGQPGIVALSGSGEALDSNGHCWNLTGPTGWVPWPDYDPPVPVAQIKFWERDRLITMDNDFWRMYGVWTNYGPCPGLSAINEPTATAMSASPKAIPNPSAGSCRVAFQTATSGQVSVQVFDASGRLIRKLHDGPLPGGEFSLSWDGRDDGGQDLPAGVYFAKVITSIGPSTTKLVLAR